MKHTIPDEPSESSTHSEYPYSISNGGSSASNDENETDVSSVSLRVAQREQKAVLYSQILVGIVLTIALTATVLSTYFLIANEERKDFESQFTSYASKVIAVSHENTKNTYEAIEAFSISMTSIASFTNMPWPFVTIPDFAARAERLMNLSHARGVGVYNLVQDTERLEWSNYTQQNAPIWYKNTLDYIHEGSRNDDYENTMALETLVNKTRKDIWTLDFTTYELLNETEPAPWLVVWQAHPIDELLGTITTNFNVIHSKRVADVFYAAAATHAPSLGFLVEAVGDQVNAESQIIQPIFQHIENRHQGSSSENIVVAAVTIVIDWVYYFDDLLPENDEGIVVVLNSTCDHGAITYQIDGLEAKLLGEGDQHDPKYDKYKITAPFAQRNVDKTKLPPGFCAPELSLNIYPSQQMEDEFTTNRPILYAVRIIIIFTITCFVFLLYDHSVRRRQRRVMARLIRQDKIVLNMFPTNIRNQLYGVANDGQEIVDDDKLPGLEDTTIAELFPCATICFADIAGFTAWSSAREPPQVFELLEKIFGSFDEIAQRHGVFKVETVGDCYVAAAGIPHPKKDHVVHAARFARNILFRMKTLTKALEVTLGPDTGDLELRVGINSGQVTAGVLRGKRSRFQLFGDAVNTAARMESTSNPNCVHLSHSSAQALIQAGKGHWIKPRDTKILVKGKGEMQTYWLDTSKFKTKAPATIKTLKSVALNGSSSATRMTIISEDNDDDDYTASENTSDLNDDIHHDYDDDNDGDGMELDKTQRLVEWNVEVLSKLLQQIQAARDSNSDNPKLMMTECKIGSTTTVLEEFVPIITFRKIGIEDLKRRKHPNSIELDDAVKNQLRGYLTKIAGMYRNNPFHNFEHASHVTASVRKLLTRITKVHSTSFDQGNGSVELVDLAGHSYGITSDPLTQFAAVFSAVIHDVDHPGVPNAQLVKEKTQNSIIYKEKSVAEQTSVDLAWDLLMKPEYTDLRRSIYSNEDELKQFRQLVVNIVMATDICDKELQALRKARWETAFAETQSILSSPLDTDRKATIVIEHLIQASDVSHTMQHWEIFRQWNERLFMEMYDAYKAGRGEVDPSINWYKSEIGFFDFYIIPLAKKLENCGVFGVSSHEYLNYAMANRDEWEREGQKVVEGYLKKVKERGSARVTKRLSSSKLCNQPYHDISV